MARELACSLHCLETRSRYNDLLIDTREDDFSFGSKNSPEKVTADDGPYSDSNLIEFDEGESHHKQMSDMITVILPIMVRLE